jgi:hypothetical protein
MERTARPARDLKRNRIANNGQLVLLFLLFSLSIHIVSDWKPLATAGMEVIVILS